MPRHGSSSWRRNADGCCADPGPRARPRRTRASSAGSRPSASLLSLTRLYGPRTGQVDVGVAERLAPRQRAQRARPAGRSRGRRSGSSCRTTSSSPTPRARACHARARSGRRMHRSPDRRPPPVRSRASARSRAPRRRGSSRPPRSRWRRAAHRGAPAAARRSRPRRHRASMRPDQARSSAHLSSRFGPMRG